MSPLPRLFCCLHRPVAALGALLVLGAAEAARASIIAPPTVTNSATPFSPAFVASNTVDQTEFEYASQGQGVDTFIEYAFATPQTFDHIVVMNRNSPAGSDLIGDFTLTFNASATTSITRAPQRGASLLHSIGLRTATTVRLDVDTIGTGDVNNNTGAMEVIFVRTPVGQSQINASISGSAPAFGPFFAATNAVDGDIGRSSATSGDGPEYASASLGADAFVDFDLGGLKQVGGFDFFDRPADEDRVTGFDLIFSRNSTFGDGDDVIRSYANSAMALGDVFPAIAANFVRFDVTSNLGANTGMTEMVFYQVPEPSAVSFLAFGVVAFAHRRRR